ncbi:MAG: hypothetical protein KDD83_04285, partial [Caldilineaceae bacterium]|nr:hypothetical protein [Caldilineaceae bacterium]
MQPLLSSTTMPYPSLLHLAHDVRQRCCNMLLIAAILLSIVLPLATEPLPALWQPRTVAATDVVATDAVDTPVTVPLDAPA